MMAYAQCPALSVPQAIMPSSHASFKLVGVYPLHEKINLPRCESGPAAGWMIFTGGKLFEVVKCKQTENAKSREELVCDAVLQWK